MGLLCNSFQKEKMIKQTHSDDNHSCTPIIYKTNFIINIFEDNNNYNMDRNKNINNYKECINETINNNNNNIKTIDVINTNNSISAVDFINNRSYYSINTIGATNKTSIINSKINIYKDDTNSNYSNSNVPINSKIITNSKISNISTNDFISNKNNRNYKAQNSSILNKTVNKVLLEQLKGSVQTKNLSLSTKIIRKKETFLNFKENNIQLLDREKAGCGQNSINTFCLFKSINNETFLVYPVKNSFERNIRIYALNMDNNEKKIIFEEFEEKNNIAAKKNRRIPTQCKYYNIGKDEYIITGFRDSCIYIWELKNSEFEKIKTIENKGEQINGICLFKNKENNELNIIYSEYEKSKIYIMNLNEDKRNLNIKKNIYFLELLEKDNKLYILVGLLDIVISFDFKESSPNYKIYQIDKKLYRNLNGKGHECVIIYKPNENENEIKIIDSDTEGKCINIFNFESTQLLLILDLITCKPLGINIWNEKYIIVSCLESIDNDSIKIININLNKRFYNQKEVNLFKNEDGAEGKIVVNLKGHENGTISTLNMKNERYGEFFVSIGKDSLLKLWINNSLKSSFEFNE